MSKHRSVFNFVNFSEGVDPFGIDLEKIKECLKIADRVARIDVDKSFTESMGHLEEAMKKWKLIQNQKNLHL